METQPIKTTGKLKIFFVSFFFAGVLSVLFAVISLPFLIDATEFSEVERASILQINLWRIVTGFGLLSAIATIYFLTRKNKRKLIPIFLWVFWFFGALLVSFSCYKNGGIELSLDILKVSTFNIKYGIIALAILPYFVWIFGVYYCKEVARRLGMNTKLATLAGIFLPIISALVYLYLSFRKKERAGKIKILKIAFSTILLVSLATAGIIYYVIGTPEYSLYKLKQALLNYNDAEFAKYFDVESIADNFGETPGETMDWIIELNSSILEIKEENPDSSKDAEAYISTGLTGINLEVASIRFSSQENGSAQISLKFDDYGSKLLAKITKRNIGKKIGVYLSGYLNSEPVVQAEILNGEAMIFGQNATQARFMVDTINTEKLSQINGFRIRRKDVDDDSAKIAIGKNGNENGFELALSKTKSRYWIVNKIDTIIINDGEAKLPIPEGEKIATFNWKYKGKNYSLDQKLYDSYYSFYNNLPAEDVFNGESLVGKLEKDNELFIKEFDGDKTIKELAQSIKLLGEKNNLNENQLAELASAFVQTIPYDTEKFNNRKAGLNGVAEKPTYPYEVLYSNKGVCQDKSYLAYLLLKEMGYGVSFFLFPDPAENHMAVGIKCPAEYSNYDSGYCFLETTSLGNKIGWSPNLSKEFGTATSKVELSDFSNDSTESDYSPLGRIEVLNKIDGLAYTGIIDTIKTQKEIDTLLYSIRKMDNELDALRKDLDNQDDEVGKMSDKLEKLEKNLEYDNYDNYKSYYSKYKKAYSAYEKDRKTFNAKIDTRNQLNDKYNSLINSFYQ